MLIKKGLRKQFYSFFFFWGGGEGYQAVFAYASHASALVLKLEQKTPEPLLILIAPIILCTVSCLNLKIAIKPSLARSRNNF